MEGKRWWVRGENDCIKVRSSLRRRSCMRTANHMRTAFAVILIASLGCAANSRSNTSTSRLRGDSGVEQEIKESLRELENLIQQSRQNESLAQRRAGQDRKRWANCNYSQQTTLEFKETLGGRSRWWSRSPGPPYRLVGGPSRGKFVDVIVGETPGGDPSFHHLAITPDCEIWYVRSWWRNRLPAPYRAGIEYIENGIAKRGMPDRRVESLIGPPDDINRSSGSWGVHEQWVYRQKNLYLYFENGMLESWQN